MSVPITPVIRPRRVLLAPLAMLAGATLLVGCAAASTPAASTAAPKAATAAPVSTSSSAPAAQASPAASRKVNPNTASIPDIQQALEANGVPNAARWAREVDEYKPYPADDPTWGKLRQNLAKYNPAPDVLEKIIASLTLT